MRLLEPQTALEQLSYSAAVARNVDVSRKRDTTFSEAAGQPPSKSSTSMSG